MSGIPIKIMIVDDEEDITQALKTHFELSGYHVEIFCRAKEALAALEKESYQLIISDINMPEMDGLEFLEKAKKLRGDTIVIMMTAFTTISKVLSSRYHGASDYLLKPFRDLSELDVVFERALTQIRRWNEVMTMTKSEVQSV